MRKLLNKGKPRIPPGKSPEMIRLMKEESFLIKQVLMKSAPKDNPDYSLPEILDITIDEFIDVYPDWQLWQATEKKFLLTELRKQPRDKMEKIIYLDSLLEKLSGEFYDRKRKEAEAKK